MKFTDCAGRSSRWKRWKLPFTQQFRERARESKILICHLLNNRFIFQPYFHRHFTCEPSNFRFYFSFFFAHPQAFDITVTVCQSHEWINFFRIANGFLSFVLSVAQNFSLFMPCCLFGCYSTFLCAKFLFYSFHSLPFLWLLL